MSWKSNVYNFCIQCQVMAVTKKRLVRLSTSFEKLWSWIGFKLRRNLERSNHTSLQREAKMDAPLEEWDMPRPRSMNASHLKVTLPSSNLDAGWTSP